MTPPKRPPTVAQQVLAKHGPNARVESLGHRLTTQTAPLVTLAVASIMAELEDRAPHVGGSDTSRQRVSGGGRTVWVPEDEHGPGEHVPVTSVEAAAMRADTMQDMREEIRDRIDGVVVAVQSLDRFLRSIGGDLADVVPELCDGSARSYDGHRLVWSAYSRNPNNGWHDPTCRDIADPTGLCPRCLVRMNAWRKRQGLATVGVKAAA